MTGTLCGGGTWKFHGTLAVLRHFLENLKILYTPKKNSKQNSVAVFFDWIPGSYGFFPGRSKSSSFQFSPKKKRHVHLLEPTSQRPNPPGLSSWTFLKGDFSAAGGHVDVCPTIKPKSSYNLKWLRESFTDSQKKGVKVIGYRSCCFFVSTMIFFAIRKGTCLFFLLFLYTIYIIPRDLHEVFSMTLVLFFSKLKNRIKQLNEKKNDDCYLMITAGICIDDKSQPFF